MISAFPPCNWSFKLGIVFAISIWRCERPKQNDFPVCYVTEEKILAVNEEAVPENTKKATKACFFLFLAVKLSPKPTKSDFFTMAK